MPNRFADTPPDLSIVVLAYEMRDQVMRTLAALAPAHQHDVDMLHYEVVVVDNGSRDEPLEAAAVSAFGPHFRLVTVREAHPSPVRAVNAAVASTAARYVGVILDGACLVTPGVIAGAMLAQRLGERVLATAFAWHLGPDTQQRSALAGYGPAVEAELLARAGWPANGYALFDVATIDPSNPQGWFGPIAESRFFVMPRSLWDELGGYDERFESPGGGLAALDFFCRAANADPVRLVGLLGEGTFHQVHGGITTSAQADHWEEFHAEYEAIVGSPWVPPDVSVTYLGQLSGVAREWVGAARVADDLTREMRVRRAAIPVQGARLFDAPRGFYDDGWVARVAAMTVVVSRLCTAIEIEGWLPGESHALASLRVDGRLVAEGPVGPGVFVLRAEALFEPDIETEIVISCDREIESALRRMGDERDISWQVGVVRLLPAFVVGQS